MLGYRSKEIQSMDLSLILLLFRQEAVKDPTMKVTVEKEITFSSIKGQMVEFSGGQNIEQKMWIVATKHNFTGYVFIVRGTMAMWNADPDFALRVLETFTPK